MTDVVIKAEGLGKKYVIGHQAGDGRYVALRDVLTHNIRTMWHKTKDLFRGDVPVQGDSREDIWALRDIDFEMRRGEVVGIIGRNGSGKSTLLKILSRITEPTEGRVGIRGRVSSLLEVGTGFHPELTGRENIFLNGAILGMTRAEIRRKFDEIVAFAEIEKFLDTPVKRYSSGMYVRLAFAVAAHLEPEILLVDEVLAVGDADFQKKCLGKMEGVAREGRTVLFVSHNTVAIERLCSSALLLTDGRIAMSGDTQAVVQRYLGSMQQEVGPRNLEVFKERRGTGEVRFTSIEVQHAEDASDAVRVGEPFVVRLTFDCKARAVKPVFSISLWSMNGHCLFVSYSHESDFAKHAIDSSGQVDLILMNPNLLPGRYSLHCAAGTLHDPLSYDHIVDASFLEIRQGEVARDKLYGVGWSSLFFDCEWRMSSFPMVKV